MKWAKPRLQSNAKLLLSAMQNHVVQPASLVKPWTLLLTIRKLAHYSLYKPGNWREYDRGLALYLLGALKFKNLDRLPEAPQPKQVAFWAAASAVDLWRQPLSAPPATRRPLIKQTQVWLAAGSASFIVLLVLAFVVWWGVAGQRPSTCQRPVGTEPMIAVMTNVKPEVKIDRAGAGCLDQGEFGADLFQEDFLLTRPGAGVEISCKDGPRLWLSEKQYAGVIEECQGANRVAEVLGPLPESVSKTLGTPTPIPTPDPGNRAGRSDQANMPLLLSPRNSVITDTRPTFTWQPVAGASGYRLTLTPGKGSSWSKETTDTSLRYPADAPPLVADGSSNIVELALITDTTGTAIDTTRLNVLTETAQIELAQAEGEILALPLDESTQRFFLAQLYRQRKMWSAALEQLIPLAQAQNPPSATLWQQIGDLYMQVELYTLAEQSYSQALTAAQANEDVSGQAAAQFGLARTALSFDEMDKTLEHLNAAESLYRQAGQKDLADTVAQERDKLKEE